jgi:Tol biopolymer transport system component
MVDLERGVEDAEFYRGPLDDVRSAAFLTPEGFARLGTLDSVEAWYVDRGDVLRPSSVPVDAVPQWVPNGRDVAFTRASGPGLFIGEAASPKHYLNGPVTGFSWAPDGSAVFAIVFHVEDGLSSLERVNVGDGTVETLAENLDATYRLNSIGVSPDGKFVFVSLAGEGPPDPEARHRPEADRDMDVYRLEVATGELSAEVTGPGDDFFPVVVGEHLYWTHNEMHDDVVVLPIDGGNPTVLVEDAQIPMWSHDGSRIAFTFGGWRIADWGLNFDAGTIDFGENGRAKSAPEPVVVGYHEDFTPTWSPDGKWLAYHSHRSVGPVATYSAEGSTDDIYLRRAGAPMEAEIRLTDFGWEVGNADWAPDGRRLLFDSWERGGTPGVARPWIATIDTVSGGLIELANLPLPEGFGDTLFGAWAPFGDKIAMVGRIDGSRQAIWILSSDGSESRRLVQFESRTHGGVDWTPDGETVVYAALVNGHMQLFAVPGSGGPTRQLSRGEENLIHPQVSPDGRWIAATRIRRGMELRRVALSP